MGRLKSFFITRKTSIHDFYTDALRRMSVIEKLHDTDSESVDNFSDWSKRYHETSAQLQGEYDRYEERLKEYIYPILDGRITMTQRLAHVLIEEIRSAISQGCRDSLITADVLEVIIDFYEQHTPKIIDDRILALFMLADCYLSYGIDEKFRRAVEYYTMAISFSTQFDQTKNVHTRGMIFESYYKRLVGESLKSRCDIAALYDYYKDAVTFYDDLENRKVSDLPFEFMSKSSQALMQYEALSKSRVVINRLAGIVNESADAALAAYERNIRRQDKEMNALILVNYALANVYKNQMSPVEAYGFLVESAKKLDMEVDYSNPSYYLSPKFVYTLYWVPEMMVLLEESGYSIKRIGELRKKLALEVFEAYARIPYDKRTYITNSYVYMAYKYVLPYYDITFTNLDLLMKVTIIRHNSMAIHSKTVMLIATELVKAMIQESPELLVGTMNCKSAEDVKAHIPEIMDFVRKAAFCHDIGKIVLPNIINIQYRKATPTETSIIEMHPQIGSVIIDRVPALKVFYDIVMGHHKSYDGTSGYPEGYNNCISAWRFITDMIHICDALEAGTDMYERLYKERKTFEDIIAELKEGRCTEYNPEIVDFIIGNERLLKTIEFLVTEGREVYLYFMSRITDDEDEIEKVIKGEMIHEK